MNKLEKLNETDWKEIRRHPEIGYRILSSANEFAEIADHILAHHEHWDGSGYPKGLSGRKIPLLARIIGLAEAYDALLTEQHYPSSARAGLVRLKDKLHPSDIAEAERLADAWKPGQPLGF